VLELHGLYCGKLLRINAKWHRVTKTVEIGSVTRSGNRPPRSGKREAWTMLIDSPSRACAGRGRRPDSPLQRCGGPCVDDKRRPLRAPSRPKHESERTAGGRASRGPSQVNRSQLPLSTPSRQPSRQAATPSASSSSTFAGSTTEPLPDLFGPGAGSALSAISPRSRMKALAIIVSAFS
jgi:hypothetical protein